jgi:PAS domain S-box-containing protein
VGASLELTLPFDLLPSALLAYGTDGRVLEANRSAHDLLGVEPSGLVGSLATEAGWLITDPAGWPDAENVHPALAAIRTGQPQRGVIAHVKRPDGTEIWIQIDAVPVAAGSGGLSYVVAHLTDVTGLLTDLRLPRPGYGASAIAEVTTQLMVARLDPQVILKSVTTKLSELRPGTWVATLMNKDPRTVIVVASDEADPQAAAYIEDVQLRSETPLFGVSNQVIETGEAVLLPSLRGEVAPQHAGHFGALVAPMRARGAVVGTLGLFEPRGSQPLTERDVRWVQEVADRTGLAVENAQLYVDAVNRLERLTALRSVGLAIAGSPDLRLTLQVILDQTVAGLGVDAADVLLIDESDGMLGLVASTGFQATSIPDYRLPVDDELPGRVLQGRRIETITALGAFGQFRRRTLFAREGFKAYGAVPLIAAGKLAGVLEVFQRSSLQPDQEWLQFLDALGNDASIAIERAGMFGRLQKAGQDSARQPRIPVPDLTRLEKEILGFVAAGLANREIAEKVHLSPHTIKFHVGQMLKKVGVSNRTELAHKATQEGWL